MTTVQLRTFILLSKLQSFSKTAENLDYAQSSVSGQIKALEEEMGVELFERIGRKVYLTDAGKAFMPYANRMYDTYLESTEVVSGTKKPSGTLIIGAPESLSVYKLPELFVRFRECYPDVELKVKMDNCCNIYSMLDRNQIDMAFVLHDENNNESYNTQIISEEEVILISAHKKCVSLSDAALNEYLSQDTLMMVEELDCCYNDVFLTHLKEDGIRPSNMDLYGSVEMIKKCVQSKMGFGLLPKMAIEEELKDETLYDCGYKHNMVMYSLLLKHPDKWMTGAMRALAELAEEVL